MKTRHKWIFRMDSSTLTLPPSNFSDINDSKIDSFYRDSASAYFVRGHEFTSFIDGTMINLACCLAMDVVELASAALNRC
jgi:hypothetical protein